MSKVFSERQFQHHLQRVSIAAVGAIAFGLGSCANNPTGENASDDQLQVVTTFLPVTQFTTAVAGDRAEVVQLLPTNVGPHEYQAKPGDAQAIAKADVLVKNGLEMEFFLDDMIENAGNADLAIVDSSEGVATLATDEENGHDRAKEEGHDHEKEHDHDHEEEHDHAEEEHDHEEEHAHAEEEHDHEEEHAHAEEEHDHEEEHAHAEDEHHHHHGEFDPHIWLDPKRAIKQVENIRDGLIAADPDGAAEYTANAAAFIAKLEALDAEIAEKLAPFSGQTFVVFHDFAAYFAESYGLESEYLVGIPEENPSPEDVKRVMEAVQAQGLTTIMTEPQADAASFETIANDLDINLSVFDPIATGDSEAVSPDYYLTTMRQNVESLAASFEASDQVWLPQWVPQPVATVPQRISLWF